MNKSLYDTLTDKEKFFADQLFEIQRLLKSLTDEVESAEVNVTLNKPVGPR